MDMARRFPDELACLVSGDRPVALDEVDVPGGHVDIDRATVDVLQLPARRCSGVRCGADSRTLGQARSLKGREGNSGSDRLLGHRAGFGTVPRVRATMGSQREPVAGNGTVEEDGEHDGYRLRVLPQALLRTAGQFAGMHDNLLKPARPCWSSGGDKAERFAAVPARGAIASGEPFGLATVACRGGAAIRGDRKSTR